VIGLGQILEQHWDPVEADFLRYYGKDLRRTAQRAGPRRLWVLIDQLPPDSALGRAMNLKPQVVSDTDEIAAWFGNPENN
jgi:hypothetical protein